MMYIYCCITKMTKYNSNNNNPFMGLIIFGCTKKSQRCKSGGWSVIAIMVLVAKSRTSNNMWAVHYRAIIGLLKIRVFSSYCLTQMTHKFKLACLIDRTIIWQELTIYHAIIIEKFTHYKTCHVVVNFGSFSCFHSDD